MRTQPQWADAVPPEPAEDGKPGAKKAAVHDLCYRPDGALLVAAVGSQLIVYDAVDGRILKTRVGECRRPRPRRRAPGAYSRPQR